MFNLLPRRLLTPLCPLAIVLAACGSSAHPHVPTPAPAVSVAGTPITSDQVTRYVRYAAGFFAAAYPAGPLRSTAQCDRKPVSAACVSLRRQVLARLIQEQVVLNYAAKHHITLTSADRATIAAQMRQLTSPGSESADLYRHDPATLRFLRSVLAHQALVLKVEVAVAGTAAASGFAYHVDKFLIPFGKSARRQALDLATDGRPVPVDAIQTTQWLAPFRLHGALGTALRAASPGDFLGPYKRARGYLVVHFVGEGDHAYGKPARIEVMQRLFQAWLKREIGRAKPKCDAANASACRLASMNGQ